MTICTQQFDVAAIDFPIMETARPIITAIFWPDFFRRVDVVDIECSMIGKAAFRTFSAKFCNQFKFAFPCPASLVDSIAVPVPIGFLAFRRAKPNLTRNPTRQTFTVLGPTMGEIARLAAIMAGAIADTVGVHRIHLAAMSTRAIDSLLSHTVKISCCAALPKYFDIACKRIDAAVREPRLPLPEPRPKQASML